MFCPSCGSADQLPESFCRSCGEFLPDFDALQKKRVTPEQHLLANGALSAMTAVTSLVLALALYYFYLGKDGTPWIIYLTAGFLTAIFFWQVQSLWRTVLLKKHLPKRDAPRPSLSAPEQPPLVTAPLLDRADPAEFIAADVTDDPARSRRKSGVSR